GLQQSDNLAQKLLFRFKSYQCIELVSPYEYGCIDGRTFEVKFLRADFTPKLFYKFRWYFTRFWMEHDSGEPFQYSIFKRGVIGSEGIRSEERRVRIEGSCR